MSDCHEVELRVGVVTSDAVDVDAHEEVAAVAAELAEATAGTGAGTKSVGSITMLPACSSGGGSALGSDTGTRTGTGAAAPPARPTATTAGTGAATALLPNVPAALQEPSWTDAGVLSLAPHARLPTVSHVIVAYRVSSGGYSKVKPAYITKEGCLLNAIATIRNFVTAHPAVTVHLLLVKDKCTPALSQFASLACKSLLTRDLPADTFVLDEHETMFGDGAQSYNYALSRVLALAYPRHSTAVYMLEDDYLHVKSGLQVVLQGLQLAPYVTGYDHPDKYVTGGGNPLITGSGEWGRAYRGHDRHWRMTNSTTMTFATSLAVLETDEQLHRLFTQTAPPDDFHLFLTLGAVNGRMLLSPMPAVSTHGETAFLAPFVNWAKLGAQAAKWVEELQETVQESAQQAAAKS